MGATGQPTPRAHPKRRTRANGQEGSRPGQAASIAATAGGPHAQATRHAAPLPPLRAAVADLTVATENREGYKHWVDADGCARSPLGKHIEAVGVLRSWRVSD